MKAEDLLKNLQDIKTALEQPIIDGKIEMIKLLGGSVPDELRVTSKTVIILPIELAKELTVTVPSWIKFSPMIQPGNMLVTDLPPMIGDDNESIPHNFRTH